MRGSVGGRHLLRTIPLALAIALVAAAVGQAATLHTKLLAKAGYGSEPPNFVRSADGTLHVVLEANIDWGDSFNGVQALSISSTGHIGPSVRALNWGTPSGANGIPGVAVLSGGALEAAFGGSPSGDNGPWGISSTDGGATWTAPTDIGSGLLEAGDGDLSLQVSNGVPVFTAGCCGGIVVQQGFGIGSHTFSLTSTADDDAGNVDTALDASTGAVIAGWDSNAGSGGLWLQQIAPTTGSAQKAPVPTQYGTGIPLILAGRDSGPGVFAAYPKNYGATTRMGVVRYGGGSVPVGSVKGLHASNWGIATGKDGRVWVIWFGNVNGKSIIAVSRSNQAVTRFGPVRQYKSSWSGLSTLTGDGRLGPLDLLLSGLAPTNHAVPGIYYARILPALSAGVSVKAVRGGKFKLGVKVNDAGDSITGASVSAKGHHATTNAHGTATITVAGSRGAHVTVKVVDSGYSALRRKVTL
jgi:hypothetical protein